MHRGISALTFFCLVLVLSACQRSDDVIAHPPSRVDVAEVQVIRAKTVPIALPQAEICEQVGCTRYHFQTIQTNVPWINQYFLERIQKMEPIAFEKYEGPKLDRDSLAALGLSQSSAYVRYIGQNGALATFVLHSNSYSSGAVHGLYHDEYVNLDLNEKRRVGLQDLLIEGQARAFADALYAHNKSWLAAHNIAAETLPLSDNFYFSQKGLVLVYALYELTGYPEGMPELIVPYRELHQFVKKEYLPPLPQYPQVEAMLATGE